MDTKTWNNGHLRNFNKRLFVRLLHCIKLISTACVGSYIFDIVIFTLFQHVIQHQMTLPLIIQQVCM